VSRVHCGGGWLALGLVAVMAWCAPAAVARSGARLAFGAPVRVDTDAIASLSCPSATLCVGVDSDGRLVRSTRPTDRLAAQHSTRTDSAVRRVPQPSIGGWRLAERMYTRIADHHESSLSRRLGVGHINPACRVTKANSPPRDRIGAAPDRCGLCQR
jgi:hypothetical protein